MFLFRPKSFRNRRLHIVCFLDTQRSFSASTHLWKVWTIALCTLFVLAGWSISVVEVVKAKQELDNLQSYVKELKGTVIAQAAQAQNIFLPEFAAQNAPSELGDLADIHTLSGEILSAAVQSKEDAKALSSKLSASGVERAVVDLSGETLSLASFNHSTKQEALPQVENSLPPEQTKAETAAVTVPTKVEAVVTQPIAEPASEGKPPPSTAGMSPLIVTDPQSNQFLAFQKVTLQEAMGGALSVLSFELLNNAPATKKTIIGRVCVVVSVKEGEGKVLRSVPSDEQVDLSSLESAQCSQGERVRFSRLRPMKMSIPYPHEAIDRVYLVFLDSPSERTLVQDFGKIKSF